MDKPTIRKKANNNFDWQWYQNFCGIKMSSNYYIFHLFSMILDENPQIQRIIELGTGEGSMTIALRLESIRKGIDIITYDIEDQTTPETQRIFKKLNIKIIKLDVFKAGLKFFFDVPVYLLCDNGNKIKEINTFAPLLKKGSVISVHDYGVEIKAKDIKPTNITPFKKHLWNKHNVQLATWIIS